MLLQKTSTVSTLLVIKILTFYKIIQKNGTTAVIIEFGKKHNIKFKTTNGRSTANSSLDKSKV